MLSTYALTLAVPMTLSLVFYISYYVTLENIGVVVAWIQNELLLQSYISFPKYPVKRICQIDGNDSKKTNFIKFIVQHLANLSFYFSNFIIT